VTAVNLFVRLTIEGDAVTVGCDLEIASETFEMLTAFLGMDGIPSAILVEVVSVCSFVCLICFLSFWLYAFLGSASNSSYKFCACHLSVGMCKP